MIRVFVLALWLGLYASASSIGGASPPLLPDPATGNLDGKTAVAVAPTKIVNDKPQTISPLGFDAHLTGYDDPSVDLVFPCGVWFQPPPARYRVWIEGDWQISPFSLVIVHSGRAFRGRGLTSAVPVGEAGRVALPPNVQASHLTLRLLHAGSYLDGTFLRWELSRRRATSEVRDGLLMPVGLTIGALWDERTQRYTALSRPFEVKARKTVTLAFERATGVSHVVAQVQRHALDDDPDVKVLLRRQNREVPPDLKVTMADRAYAVWYGLAPGPAELRAESTVAILDPQKLKLEAGKIERVLATLKARPALGF